MAIPHDSSAGCSFQHELGDEFHRKRILVTGATGFVSLNLCQALHTVGAEVVHSTDRYQSMTNALNSA